MRKLYSACFACLATFASLQAQDAAMPADRAARTMALPPGFHATLFAGEPDLVQPIAFSFDDRGRLWVVECLSYPKWATGGVGRDRVVIFEDVDGDGKFDRKTVFYDRGVNLTGIALGFGGVWLCSTPNLVFIPDRNGDDKPDGPPEVILDGWDLAAKHNVFNSPTWGPDGWMYGCNGILSNSKVGKPGASETERTALNCGVWRYHPLRKTFEVVAHGTTNPWGLDFDDYGQGFITNCVIQHLWHVIPGAHFQRMFGQDLNPQLYSFLGSCADHIHWGGGDWTSSRGGQGAHSTAGGGHAHSGAMIYLGDNWPDEYRNGVFTCNLHGLRVNHDVLEQRGSGCVARHAQDLLFSRDPWFRGVAIQYGPDGGVYIADWSDTGECHNYETVSRSSGRIFKVTYGAAKNGPFDLSRLSDAELVERQLHRNDWHVRHARRLLQERAAAGKLSDDARFGLWRIVRSNPDVTRKLRALWTLHVVGGFTPAETLELLTSPDPAIRAWTVALSLEDRSPSDALLKQLNNVAVGDSSPRVRLQLAAGLQRIPLSQRWGIAEALIAHAEDAGDANLPLMLWYGVEPLAAVDPERAAGLISMAKIPLLREYVARRLATLAK